MFEQESIRSSLISLKDHKESIKPTGQAAVLVPIIYRDGDLCLLLTKRAINMRHHGGEIAFPGGMWERGEEFPVKTALREAEEEIALLPQQVDVLGLLPGSTTRQGMQVTPVVGLVNEELSLKANPAEIHSIFYVPLVEFLPDKRVRTDVFDSSLRWAPAYTYDGHEIWGFTAVVIKMLLNRCFDVPFERKHSAPEKLWH